MAILYQIYSFSKKAKYLQECVHVNYFMLNSISNNFSTYIERPKFKRILKYNLIGAAVGFVLGTGYTVKKIADVRQAVALEGTEITVKLLKYKPDVKPSRTVISPIKKTALQLTLFQYQNCPFCCKVRVLLDYYGLSYDIVEVDPVLRQEINWSNYKKVPILLVKVDREYLVLTDSSMIVSILASYLYDKSININELAKYYPTIATHDDKGKFKYEIINKYFLMYQTSMLQDKNFYNINEEHRWRKWTDDVFVHTLSPNVYRTLKEAYQTFNWFAEVGHWEEYFAFWERAIIIYVGAFIMWLISKKLKKQHNLKNDVRQSLYDEINIWLNEIHSKGSTFMGGLNPDLCDLAVYGVLKSIEGCEAFKDALINTNLAIWYHAVKEKVESHAGSVYLSN